MIQRPQTLILIIAIILIALSMVLPTWEFSDKLFGTASATSYALTITPNGKPAETQLATSFILGLASIGFIGFIISKFKNRVLQMKLVMVAQMLLAGYVAVYTMMDINKLIEILKTKVPSGTLVVGTQTIAYFLPLGALVLLIVSKYLIKKDEDLVRSADRMR